MKSIFTLCIVALFMSTQAFSQICGGVCPSNQTFSCYPPSQNLFELMGGVLPDLDCLNNSDPSLNATSIEAINNFDNLIGQGLFATCGGSAEVTFGFRTNNNNLVNLTCNAVLTITPETNYTCLPDRTISCYDDISSLIDPNALIANNTCDAYVNVSVGPIIGDPCADDSFSVTYTISDDCNGEYECIQNFTYSDGPFSIICPSNQVVSCPENIFFTTGDIEIIGGSNCQGYLPYITTVGPILMNDIYAPSCSGAQYRVTYTANDGCQQASCDQIFTIENNPLTVVCNVENTFANCIDDIPTPTINDVTITGNCNGVDTLVTVVGPTLISGSGNCNGDVYEIIYNAQDACGNVGACSRTVTISNFGIELYCPSEYFGYNNNFVSCVEDIPTPSESDLTIFTDCNLGYTVSIDGPILISGQANCPDARYDITYTVNDNCGNSTACSESYFISGNALQAFDTYGNTNYTVACESDISLNAENITVNSNCELGYDFVVTGPTLVYGQANCQGAAYTVEYVFTDDCGSNAYVLETYNIIQEESISVTCPDRGVNVGVNNFIFVDCFEDITSAEDQLVVENTCDNNYNVDVLGPFPIYDYYYYYYGYVDECSDQIYGIRYNIVDECGNQDVCFEYFFIEYSAPSISCPAAETVSCFSDIQANINDVIATTHCDNGGTVTASDPILVFGTDLCNGAQYEITYTLIDGCQNQTTCTQVFTIQHPLPTISCPEDETVENFSQISALINISNTVTTASTCFNNPVTVQGPFLISGNDGQPGSQYEVIYTINNACNESAECSQIIKIETPDPPEITCPNDMTVNCFSDVVSGTPTITDYCQSFNGTGLTIGDPVFTGFDNNGNTIYTIEYTYIDACGVSVSCIQTFVVLNSIPTMTCAPDLIVSCAVDIAASEPTVNYPCNPFGTITYGGATLVAGSENCNGAVYEIVYELVDGDFTVASCTQTFTIEDYDVEIFCDYNNYSPNPETVTCESNINIDIYSIYAFSNCGIGIDEITAVGPTLTSGSPNCNGATYEVVYTAIDSCSNMASCTKQYVIENFGIEIYCNYDLFNDNNDNENEFENIPVNCVENINIDNYDINVVTACSLGYTIDSTDPILILGDENCNGSIYEVISTTTDDCGQTASCSTFFIINNELPTIICSNNVETVTCSSEIVVDQTLLDITTSCNLGYSIDVGQPVLSYGQAECPGATYEVTIQLTDNCGSIAFCTQIFAIDNEAPTITCAPDEVVASVNDIVLIDPTYTTSCGDGILTFTGPTYIETNPNTGSETYEVVYTVTDTCQRIATCTQTYFTEDCIVTCNTDPCLGDIESIDPDDVCSCIIIEPQVFGCTNDAACNFNPNANCDDGTCTDSPVCNTDPCLGDIEIINPNDPCNCIIDEPQVLGCTNDAACNYNPNANCDDGTCTDSPVCNTDPCLGDIEIIDPNDSCNCIVDEQQVLGCTSDAACNYNPNANCDDGSCTDSPVCNTDPCLGDIEIIDPNNSCNCIVDEFQVLGCTDDGATNYNPEANCDDNSCTYCAATASIDFSSTIACTNDIVTVTATMQSNEPSSWSLYLGDSNGNLLGNLVDENNTGIFTIDYEVINTNCAAMNIMLTVVGTCTNDGSIIGNQTETISIYPSIIDPFISIQTSNDGCTLTANVINCDDANGESILNVLPPSVQGPASPGESGIYTFCFLYDDDYANNCIIDNCVDIAYTCEGCDIEAGTLEGNAILCDQEIITVNAIGSANIDNDCALVYVLHTGESINLGTILASNSNGIFTNDGTYLYNESLCITAVAGCSFLPNGIPDPAGECYDESNCLPIVFVEPINIITDEICNDDTGTFMVSFTITGGGPTYLPGVYTYEIIGDYNNAETEPGTYIFGPFNNGDIYNINVIDDGLGCMAQASGSINCGAFDLALIKSVNNGQNNVFQNGDMVTFTINIINQGSIAAQNIEVIDYIPNNMSLAANNPGWQMNGTDAMFMLASPLAAGQQTAVNINLMVNGSGSAVNVAEIASAQDVNGTYMTDIDSNADSNKNNDAGGAVNSPADNTVNGNGTGNVGGSDPITDEDDSDPAFIIIEDICNNNAGNLSLSAQTACFNQAITAATSGTSISPGSTIAYYLHNSPVGIGNIIYANNNTGVFINDGLIPTNIDMMLTVVVGPIGADGQPILTDDCTSISQNMPVRFYNPIVINHDYVCDPITGEYQVIFDISGGSPSFPGNQQGYEIGGVLFGTIQPNVVNTVVVDADAIGYNIVVIDDGNECTASAANTLQDCFVLDIELISFTGEVLEPGNILKWQTASEIDNDYFILERSNDNGQSWTEVNIQPGSGTTTVTQSYEYLDRDAPVGISWYRLWQVDYDGTINYVGVVDLIRGEKIFSIIALQHNPAIDILQVHLNSNIEKEVTVQIINAAGQIMLSNLQWLHYDLNNLDLNLNNMANGVYIISIDDGSMLLHQKFIKN